MLKGWRGERCHNADFDRLRAPGDVIILRAREPKLWGTFMVTGGADISSAATRR